MWYFKKTKDGSRISFEITFPYGNYRGDSIFSHTHIAFAITDSRTTYEYLKSLFPGLIGESQFAAITTNATLYISDRDDVIKAINIMLDPKTGFFDLNQESHRVLHNDLIDYLASLGHQARFSKILDTTTPSPAIPTQSTHSPATKSNTNNNLKGILVFKKIDGTTFDSANGQRKLDVITSNSVDGDNSQIWAGSTFQEFRKDGDEVIEVTRPKDTDDKIVIGYTYQGLPFQIVVDGFYGGQSELTYQFIDLHVVPLMEEYAQRLSSGTEEASVITSDIIKRIYELRSKHAPDAEFTMALALTYQKQGKLYSAGFGVGDIGLVIRRENGIVDQLTHNVKVYESDDASYQSPSKDAFDSYSTQNVDAVIARNSIFDTEVHAGEEILGYTSLPQGMEVGGEPKETHPVNKRAGKQNAIKNSFNTSVLNDSRLSKATNFFSNVREAVRIFQDDAVQKAKTLVAQAGTQRIGDDCAIACVKIPTSDMQQTTKILVAIDQYLIWMKENATGTRCWSRWSHFYHGDRGIQRAINLCNFINSDSKPSYAQILSEATQTYKESGTRNHSLARFLHPALFGGENVVGVDSDAAFKEKKDFALKPPASYITLSSS